MPRLEFDPKFSIGNVVTIGMLVVSLISGFFMLTGNVASNAREIAIVAGRVDALERNFGDLIRQLGAEKVDQTRILTDLQADMRYTRAAVDELRQRGL